MEKIIICGIDPGLVNTGWGIISSENNMLDFIAAGVITPSVKLTIEKRLLEIHLELSRVLSSYNPDDCAIENIFVNSNNVTSLKLGYAKASAIITIALAQKEFFEYAPNLVKKAVVGRGKADKTQVQYMVNFILPKAKAVNEHIADALAVAICHASHRRSKSW